MTLQSRRKKCGTLIDFSALLLTLTFVVSEAKPNEEPTEEEASAADAEKLPSIDIGDSLPTLTLKNEKNEDVQIADLTSEKGVVLFLVPKADTRKYMKERSLRELGLNCSIRSWLHNSGVRIS